MFHSRTRTDSASAQSPPLTRSGPEYAADGMNRTSSRGTTNDSHEAPSVKKERRRSSLFGLLGGRKDEKDHKHQPPSPPAQAPVARSSFHIPSRDSNDNRYPSQAVPHSQSMTGPHTQSYSGRPSGQNWQGEVQRPDQGRVVSSPQPNGRGPGQYRGPAPPGQNPNMGGMGERSQSMGFTPQRPTSQSSMGTSTNTHRAASNSPSASDPTQSPRHRNDSSTPTGSPGPVAPAKISSRDAATPTTIGQAPGTDVPPPAAWTRPFQPIVELIGLQPAKVYGASPPELEMIVAKTSAGGPPKQGPPGSVHNDWDSSWLQLAGTSLSLWSMKETRAAAAKGEKVPPTYYNVTDSSLEILAPLPPPPHRPTSRPHPHVFSLNTAGSNRMLFSCPTERDLAMWVTALRLSAYEKSRLEEIYTGHVLKTFYSGRPGQIVEPRSPLVRGRLEGWVRVRVMGGTEWKRLWAVLTVAGGASAAPREEEKDGKEKKRRSFFGKGGDKEKEHATPAPPSNPSAYATACFYTAPPRGAKTAKGGPAFPPVLTMTNVTQAFAVYPEHLELIGQSNLLKVVGRIGGDMVAVEGRLRESGWAMIMPERPEEDVMPPPATFPEEMNNVALLNDMMRWIIGFHDVFKLYGRPERYTWDPMDPKSLYFAYPHGPNRGRLFIDTSAALAGDFRTEHLSEVRRGFQTLVHHQLQGHVLAGPTPPPASEKANYQAQQSPPRQQQIQVNQPSRQPNESPGNDGSRRPPQSQAAVSAARTPSFQLPPLSFDAENEDAQRTPGASQRDDGPRSLTPITERTDIASRENSTGTAGSVKHFPSASAQGPADRVKALSGSSARTLVSRGSESSAIDGTSHRLAPINDGREWTTSPAQQSPPMVPALVMPVKTVVEGPGDSNGLPAQGTQRNVEARTPSTWSQETGFSPQATIHGPSKPATPPNGGTVVQQQEKGSMPAADKAQIHPSSQLTASPQSTTFPNPHSSPETAPRAPSSQATERSPTSANQSSNLLSPKPLRVSGSSEHLNQGSNMQDEPAARYLMNMVDDDEREMHKPSGSRQVRQAAGSNDYGSSEEDEYGEGSPNAADSRVRPSIVTDLSQPSPQPSQSDITKAKSPADLTRPLGRKPSGARALPPRRQPSDVGAPRSLPPVMDLATPVDEQQTQASQLMSSTSSHPDLGDDAITALSFLDKQASPVKTKTAPQQGDREAPPAFPSSFAPTKSAADRKARADAAAQLHHEAMTMPGRGKRATKPARGAWSGSSDEDEDHDQDEEEDERSPPRSKRDIGGIGVGQPPRTSTATTSRSASRTLPPIPGAPVEQPRSSSMAGPSAPTQYPSEQSRAVSMAANAGLPPIPRIGGEGRERRGSYGSSGSPQSQSPRESLYNPAFDEARAQTGRQEQARSRPPPNRSSMWNANFDAEHGLEADKSDKFVTIEPSAQLTKAFAPHGLLQAGLQDKEERSARKQEELARETGSSLINVPNKPPPPQSGLLGAITAHERDRQHAGGIGATLTDRERERRMAEERQRKIDELQKQQLEHMSQYGGGQDMYGGGGGGGGGFQRPYSGMGSPAPMGYNNPSMMWQGGMNPYAQQQAMMAAQFAYQQAMMALSQAGSQAGEPSQAQDGGGRPVSPMMSGYGGYPGMGMPPPMGMMPPMGMGMPWQNGGMGSPMLHPMATGGSMPYNDSPGGYSGSSYGQPQQPAPPQRPRSRVQSMQEDPGHRRGKSGGSPRSSPYGSSTHLPRQGSSNHLPRNASSSQLASGGRGSPNVVS